MELMGEIAAKKVYFEEPQAGALSYIRLGHVQAIASHSGNYSGPRGYLVSSYLVQL